MKKIFTTSVLLSSLFCMQAYGQELNNKESSGFLVHSKEIGLYQSNKKTTFIKDSEILSPKSADFVENKLVINALEKGATIFYDINDWKKLPSIYHSFTFNSDNQFKNKENIISREKIKDFPYKQFNQSFIGKPVEMTHNDTKMWIPYYRLSWDNYGREGSAMAQIDIKTNTIEKIIPTGSIPKMVRISTDNKTLAVTHWGDNTVGLYTLDNNNITKYDYVVIDSKLNTSNIGGDRDVNCGWCLRGTVFTQDNRFILVGKMHNGGIAVIDNQSKKYLGTIKNVPLTPRHLVLSKDGKTLYISTCFSSEVAKISIENIYKDIDNLSKNKPLQLKLADWKTVRVGSSVRTIALSQDEKYIYAAMNDTSEIGVIDNSTMKLVYKYKVASFPVGLSVSKDDKYIAVTSQGKSGKGGGNHIDIFERTK